MKKILVADDDAIMVRLLDINLRRAGYSPVVCREGLSVVSKAQQHKPLLAVIDLMLPGKSGLELINEFKADPSLREIPLIVVTGQGKGSTKNQLLEAGASSVYTKPFSPRALIDRIKSLLEEKTN